MTPTEFDQTAWKKGMKVQWKSLTKFKVKGVDFRKRQIAIGWAKWFLLWVPCQEIELIPEEVR